VATGHLRGRVATRDSARLESRARVFMQSCRHWRRTSEYLPGITLGNSVAPSIKSLATSWHRRRFCGGGQRSTLGEGSARDIELHAEGSRQRPGKSCLGNYPRRRFLGDQYWGGPGSLRQKGRISSYGTTKVVVPQPSVDRAVSAAQVAFSAERAAGLRSLTSRPLADITFTV
jgi:hypothetical protein